MDFKEKLQKKAGDVGITLSDIQLYQYKKYYRILVESNKYMNLTAITDEDEVIEKHFIDSLSLVRIIDPGQVSTCIDIGTGAGFPGIPLKIAFPHIRITLLDSLNKRIRFLDQLVSELKMDNVILIHGRAEDIARDRSHRERYDLAVSRAVAPLPVLLEYCIPFVKKGGYFVSYKSVKGHEEIESSSKCLKILKSSVDQVEPFNLEDGYERLLIKIRKDDKTGIKYPRKAGIPSKDHL